MEHGTTRRGHGATTGRSTSARSRALLAALTLPVAVGLAGCGGDEAQQGELFAVEETEELTADYRFVIPAGSGEAIDRGEALEILPAQMDVKIGEVLELVNEDDRGHLVGPFYVGAGETLQQRFTSPGQYQGICSVHPSGQIVIDVT